MLPITDDILLLPESRKIQCETKLAVIWKPKNSNQTIDTNANKSLA